jgi:hypothetical protein
MNTSRTIAPERPQKPIYELLDELRKLQYLALHSTDYAMYPGNQDYISQLQRRIIASRKAITEHQQKNDPYGDFFFSMTGELVSEVIDELFKFDLKILDCFRTQRITDAPRKGKNPCARSNENTNAHVNRIVDMCSNGVDKINLSGSKRSGNLSGDFEAEKKSKTGSDLVL